MHQVVPAYTYLFWVKCHPSKTFPPMKLKWEPQNRPPFLPTAKPHPLNASTHDPPPMYWLGTSRWCLGPLCMLSLRLNFFFFLAFTPFLLPLHWFDSALRSSWCLSFVAWRTCGLLGLYFLSFILSWTGYRSSITLHLLAEPVLSLLYNRGPFNHWYYHITSSYLL